MGLPAKITSKAKRVATELVAGSAMGSWVAKQIGGNYILMYHGVTADGNTRFNRRHASVACFEKQIRFLKKYCSVISLEDFFEEKFDTTKPNFAITFDDGYLNNFTYAKPILEAFKCPASFFITGLNEVKDEILWADYVNIASTFTDLDIVVDSEIFRKKGAVYYSCDTGQSIYEVIKHQKAWYEYKLKVRAAFAKHVQFEKDVTIAPYWQLMNDEQIRLTSQSSYINIGSHGYYHNNLGTVSVNAAIEELGRSKKYLENLVQYDVEQLAYPDGSYSHEVIASAHSLGLKRQLAADSYLFKEDEPGNFIKKRYGIYSVDTCLNQLFTAIKKTGH